MLRQPEHRAARRRGGGGLRRHRRGRRPRPRRLARAARDCRYVVHLAAQPGVPQSVADPIGTSEVNVRGTLNALLAGRDAQVDGFVFASSNAPLGDIDQPANENMPARPKSPYGASKLAGEGYCSAFHGSYGLPTVALRFTNVYGPYSYHKGSVVASFCKQVGAGQPLVVYGDGSQTRDFLYVGDLCEGIAAALTCGKGGVVTHLGSGVETPVIDVAKSVIDKFGGDVDDRAPSRARRRRASRQRRHLAVRERCSASPPRPPSTSGWPRPSPGSSRPREATACCRPAASSLSRRWTRCDVAPRPESATASRRARPRRSRERRRGRCGGLAQAVAWSSSWRPSTRARPSAPCWPGCRRQWRA